VGICRENICLLTGIYLWEGRRNSFIECLLPCCVFVGLAPTKKQCRKAVVAEDPPDDAANEDEPERMSKVVVKKKQLLLDQDIVYLTVSVHESW
jgi:hypothetical protein